MQTHGSPGGAGLVLDPAAWRRALGLRGLLQQDLAHRAGVAETTISGALRGRPVTATTFVRLVRALAAVPIVDLPEGVGTLLAEATNDAAAEVTTPAAIKEVGGPGAQLQHSE